MTEMRTVETLGELAMKVRFTRATTPDEYRSRIEVLDADIREQHQAIGYEDGKAAGHREGSGYAGPID